MATASKAWPAEAVKTLREGYSPEADQDERADQVATLMSVLNKSKRSIVGKLVAEKLYVAPETPVKAKKDDGPTKGEILTSLKKEGYDIVGLDNATKPALITLLNFARKHRSSDEEE